MKKIFIIPVTVFIIAITMISFSQAQTSILSEGFDSNTIPSGWTKSQQPNSVGWIFGPNLGSSQYFNIPSHGNYAASNDDANDDNTTTKNDASLDYLISPVMDLTPYASTTVALSFAAFFSNSYGSIGTIEISTNGGVSWSILHTMSPTVAWESVNLDLSPYTSSSTVQIAFHHDDDGNWADGFAIDDVEVFVPVANEVALTDLTVDDFVTVSHTAPTNVNIEGSIQNNGAEPLNSIDVKWQANGGTVYTQTFSGLNIPFGSSYSFFHPYPVVIDEPEFITLNVWIENPNGTQDVNNSDNQLSTDIAGLGGTVTKNVLVEEVSGAWCGWCPLGAYVLDDLRNNYENVIVVTIHGKSGGTGDDMEIADGRTLINAYVDGFPQGFIDRKPFEVFGDPPAIGVGYSSSNNAHWYNYVEQEKTEIVPVALEMSNNYNSTTRQLTVDLTANFVGPIEGNYRLNVYILEDSVSGTGSGYNQVNYLSSQRSNPPNPNHYYYNFPATIIGFQHMQVLRAMLGGPWGSSNIIPNMVAFKDSFSKQYTTTLPANWKEKDITIVGLVQKYATKVDERPIVNSVQSNLNESASTPYTLTYQPLVGIETNEASNDNFQLYPNPISGTTAYIHLIKPYSGNFDIKVIDMTGKIMMMNTGMVSFDSVIKLNIGDLPLGSYLISLKTKDQQQVKRFIKLDN